MITFAQLKKASLGDIEDINKLLFQLTLRARPLSLKALQNILKEKNTFLFVAKDKKRIVGMGTIIIIKALVYTHAYLEDTVIDKEYRGKGIGKKLLQKLIYLAKAKKALRIDGTSRPHRIAADRLYKTLGFQKGDTNVYRLWLSH